MSKEKHEIIVPIEQDKFWDGIFQQKRNSIVPPAHPTTPSAPLNPDELALDSNDSIQSLADPRKQHEYIDEKMRSTEGIDYDQLRRDALDLVNLRKTLEEQKRMSEFRHLGKERYPQFAKKFPHFFDSIRTVEKNRLNEFLNVMHMMLDKLNQVKENMLTHTEMRTQIFEKDLAHRYYKRQ